MQISTLERIVKMNMVKIICSLCREGTGWTTRQAKSQRRSIMARQSKRERTITIPGRQSKLRFLRLMPSTTRTKTQMCLIKTLMSGIRQLLSRKDHERQTVGEINGKQTQDKHRHSLGVRGCNLKSPLLQTETMPNMRDPGHRRRRLRKFQKIFCTASTLMV